MTTAFETRRSTHKSTLSADQRRVTVVHSGARDAYQVAIALEEAGLLNCLVTDLFWSSRGLLAGIAAKVFPLKLQAQLQARSEARIPSSKVRSLAFKGLVTLLVDKLSASGFISQRLRRKAMRNLDASLGRTAAQVAQRDHTAMVSYSYYAHEAFSNFSGEGILFQLHPHPASMRRILLAELAAHPQCATSLNQEWELALPEPEFQRLISEPASASHIIAASSFTRNTLIENGIPEERITVIPYGVDSNLFVPDTSRLRRANDKLRLLFVGRINQRKGIQYLVDSLRLLNTDKVELVVCGRVVDDLAILRSLGDRVHIRPDVSREELIAAYQSSDLFVFPSVAEGFGQVLLESLACGLPILSTTRTAAPDLIEPGCGGLIVEPCKSDPIAQQIEWSLTHRDALWAMRSEARHIGEDFSWQKFRSSLASTVAGRLSESAALPYRQERQERSEIHAF